VRLQAWLAFGTVTMWLADHVPCRVTWSLWLVANRGIGRALGESLR
jgi:hypothetical protein